MIFILSCAKLGWQECDSIAGLEILVAISIVVLFNIIINI